MTTDTQPVEEIAADLDCFAEVCDQWQQLRDDAEREETELAEWLGLIDAMLHPEQVEGWEPPTAGECTSLTYGDLDIAECTAQHADWLDEKRTQEDAMY